MLKWLAGKKTYLVAAAVFVCGGLQASGVHIPDWAWQMLAAAGLASVRSAIEKGA